MKKSIINQSSTNFPSDEKGDRQRDTSGSLEGFVSNM